MPPVCRTQGETTILPAEDACIVSHPSDISRPLRSCSRKWPLTRRQSGALPFQRRRKARNCHRLYICKDRIFSEPPQEDKIGFFGPPRLIPTFSVPDRDNPTDGRKDTRATLPSGKKSIRPARAAYIYSASHHRPQTFLVQAGPAPALFPGNPSVTLSLCSPHRLRHGRQTARRQGDIRRPANAVEDRQILYGQIRYYLCFYFIIPISCHSPAINPAF